MGKKPFRVFLEKAFLCRVVPASLWLGSALKPQPDSTPGSLQKRRCLKLSSQVDAARLDYEAASISCCYGVNDSSATDHLKTRPHAS